MSQQRARLDRRVLVVAPTSKDGQLTSSLLTAAGIAVDVCPHLGALLNELAQGAAAILIPEEVIGTPASLGLQTRIDEQPAWSDLPVLLLACRGADSHAAAIAVRTLGNVTLLERPIQVTTLMTAIGTALRARDRQYQIRGHLLERASAEEALRLADRRKDEFLATLGHELRNPLSPLVMAVQLLKVANIDDPRVSNATAVMERQVKHMVRLVDDLLEVSRITRGLLDIQHEPLDLEFILHSAIDTARAAIDGPGHRLDLQLPSEPISVVGDAVRLIQVFANLLTNAAKYTPAGGRIRLAAWRDDGSVVVSVRDNGIGIPQAHLSAIFDMFMQVDRSNRHAQGGLGIGLTIVKTLVELHGGTVKARSDGPGRGSEFLVELPTVAKSVVSEDATEPPRPLPPRRILVVDDNTDAAQTLAALLQALGAVVTIAGSGRQALGLLDAFHPDAVVLDIGMPDMDGYEVARRIRARPAYRGLLLIALTGWGQDQDLKRSQAAGFDHHMIKPPDPAKLSALLIETWQTGRQKAV